MYIGKVNFPRPYRGKCGIILWNYWWREFKEKRTNLNKLKSFGLDWMVVRSEGDYCAIFPKVKNIFDFIIFILYKVSRREDEIKFMHFFFSFPILLPLHIFIFSKVIFCWKSAAPLFFLLLRFVSWVSTLVLHVLMGRLLMWVIQILRNVLLSWIHVYFIWNIKDLRLSSKKCERVEKLRKQNT